MTTTRGCGLRSLLIGALVACLPLAAPADEEAYLQVKQVRVQRGRVQLVAVDNAVAFLPDGTYHLQPTATRAGADLAMRVRHARIRCIEPDPEVAASAAEPASGPAGEAEVAAAPAPSLHPDVHTTWVRNGRLYLANRRGKQLPLPAGRWISDRGVVLTVRDRTIVTLRGPRRAIRIR